MSVGDVNSEARGSGARFNSGKAPMEFIPMRAVAAMLSGTLPEDAEMMLEALVRFEEGEDAAIDAALAYGSASAASAARVFAFGAEKYAAWNWAKGMPWSVPLACIKRHLLAAGRREEADEESRLPHVSHALCNVVMLQHYVVHYREGDDRPPRSVFPGGTARG